MEFSYGKPASSPTLTRLTVVTLFHVALGFGLINGMKIKIGPTVPPTVINIPPMPPIEREKEPEPKIVEKLKEPPPLPPIPLPEIPTQQKPDITPITVRPLEKGEPNVIVAKREEGGGGGGDHVVKAPVPDVRTAVLINDKSCEKPVYPPAAMRNGDAGTVTLSLLVGVDGRVADAKIQKSSGSRELDKAARAALSLCKFVPASVNGVPQQAWSAISYVWTIDG